MGRKISVDSASLMNKGLELIEACRLFEVTPEQVQIVIHPQSVIHSMVEYTDGSVLAQLGNPDMRTPIAHALGWPERIDSGVRALDLFEVARLDFEPPDATRFPCLRLAESAATKNQTRQDPLGPVVPPYERVPQVTLNGFVADWHGWDLGVQFDGTRFVNPGIPLPEGSRVVVNPRVAYPIQAAGWFLIPRAQLSATYYSIDAENFQYDSSQSRVLPILSLDSGLIFERDGSWFGRNAVQTLEPRLYYAWIPYRNQSTLPNFDSALADLNYVQFFTENIYSGYDRIVNANQLTFALATRILDQETGAEWLRAAIAQRYYFTPQKERSADYVALIHGGCVVFSLPGGQIPERWGLGKGDVALLPDETRGLFRGLEVGEFGFTALTDDDERARCALGPAGAVFGRPSFEDLMVHLAKGKPCSV